MRSVIIFTALTVLSCALLFWVGYAGLTGAFAPLTEKPAETGKSAKKCDGTIPVEIGGVVMLVPRDLSFQLANAAGELAQWSHPAYNCDLKKLTDLHQISDGNSWKLIAPQNGPVGKSQYFYQRRQIDAAIRLDEVETLENGMQRIAMRGAEIFLLPEKLAPARDEEPAAIFCSGPQSGGMCTSAYTLPYGLYFTYRLKRTGQSAETLLQHDRKLRAMIDDMVSNGTSYAAP